MNVGAPKVPDRTSEQTFSRTAGGAISGYGIVYAFPSTAMGALPTSPLAFASGGTIFGSTDAGGSPYNRGVAFALKPSGGTYAEQVLTGFDGSNGIAAPSALSRDASGNLWGAASTGIFELTFINGGWRSKLVYRCGTLNSTPGGPLTITNQGIYGNCDDSIVKISLGGAASTLYTFPSTKPMQRPNGNLFIDSTGAVYGTTRTFVDKFGVTHGGVVFKLTPGSGGYTESVLHSFTCKDGCSMLDGPFVDASGVIYAANYSNGMLHHGTIFRLTPQGSSYNYEVIDDIVNGLYPTGSPIMDASHSLYFNVAFSSTTNSDAGAVLKLTPSGRSYTESVVHAFQGASDGKSPSGRLAIDGSGVIYGTTLFGGAACGCGVVFRIVP